jgi:hypothetical protein
MVTDQCVNKIQFLVIEEIEGRKKFTSIKKLFSFNLTILQLP